MTTCPVLLRQEADRPSGYRFRSLLSHYWRMVVTGGTRLLRLVSIVGVLMALGGLLLAGVITWQRLHGEIPITGWASTMVVVLVTSGAVLFAIGVVAEYVGVAVNMAMGRPLFLIVADRADGPLGPPKP